MINSLQTVIYQHLTNKGYEVVDIIDENIKMPYLKLGDTRITDNVLRTGEKIHYITWDLFYWYDGSNKGRKEINSKYMDIYNSLYELLYKEAGEYLISDCELSSDGDNGITEHYIDENTILYQASIKFNFVIQRKVM
ncbi:hypothetical protein EAI30_13655 [Romboutsia ilealis]|uniref:DUF3168 domain-containing protein n=1 Tax=Romboutsia faecis TaxID=2764597 RepID=A0ABR7JT78_9FIRM|nr:hypothetical protein [Romboutsia faecis]MBC5997972.1 hypothetical protein [Romboutsia faecis]MRN25664.1 hypothetical protein [Romboutsia ilealis]